MERNLGKLGESILSHWCAQVGLTINPSTQDEHGWDFLLEFPLDLNYCEVSTLPIQCKIQVKATAGQSAKNQVALTSLYRMAVDPLPSFYFHIEFDDNNNPCSAYLKHLDGKLITFILEKIHSFKVNESPPVKFNKRKMTLKYEKSDAIHSLDGNGIKNKILENIGDDIGQYITKKGELLRNVGFENGSHKLQVMIEGEEKLEELIEVSLGLRSDVEIEDLKIFKQRFNLLSLPPLEEGKAIISMPNREPDFIGEMELHYSAIIPPYIDKIEGFIPPFINIDHQQYRYRLRGKLFDWVLWKNRQGFSCSMRTEDISQPLSEWKDTYRLLNNLNEHSSVQIVVLVKNRIILKFSVDFKSSLKDLISALDSLYAITNLCEYFGLSLSQNTTFDEIVTLSKQVSPIYKLVFSKDLNHRISFTLDDKLEDSSSRTYVGVFAFHMFDKLCGFIYKGNAVPKLKQQKSYELISTDLTILEKFCFNKSNNKAFHQMNDLLKAESEKLKEDVLVLAWKKENDVG